MSETSAGCTDLKSYIAKYVICFSCVFYAISVIKLFGLILIWPHMAIAQSFSDTITFSNADVRYFPTLGREGVHIAISDEVTDGCWVNSAATRDSIELELIRSGFTISSPDEYTILIVLGAHGWQAANELCVVHSEISVHTWGASVRYGWPNDVRTAIQSVTLNTIFRYRKLFSGPRQNSSRHIKENFEEGVKAFLVSAEREKVKITNELQKLDNDSLSYYWLNQIKP